MRVRTVLVADDYERYVVARYYGNVDGVRQSDRARSRATRLQVRAFAQAALRAFVAEHETSLHGRQRTTAVRLRDGSVQDELPLRRARETQPSLL